MKEDTDRTPVYQPPGIPLATTDDAKPMVRMINKMLRPKFKMGRTKGIQSNQNVKIGHKKKVTYW